MKRFFLFSFLFLILISSVLGLRVNGRIIFPYEPGETFEHQLCIIPEGVDYVNIQPEGVLKDRIEIEYTKLDIRAGPVCVPYKVKIPTSFENPGMQKSGLKVIQGSPTTVATISAVVAVTHQIWVDVPYPGKYLDIKLSANNADAGELIQLRGHVTSKGKEPINLVKGSADVYNWNDELLAAIKTNDLKNIGSQESGVLLANWSSEGHTVGDYHAVLNVDYDGIKEQDSTRFKLGSLEVRMNNYTGEVYKTGIVPFRIRVESYWSEIIPGVNALVKIYNGTEKKGEFQTLTQNIGPWEIRNLLGYIDTNLLNLGDYDLKIELNYGETKEYNGTLSVVEKPVLKEEKPLNINYTKLLLTSTVILSLIALILVVILIVNSKKKKV